MRIAFFRIKFNIAARSSVSKRVLEIYLRYLMVRWRVQSNAFRGFSRRQAVGNFRISLCPGLIRKRLLEIDCDKLI